MQANLQVVFGFLFCLLLSSAFSHQVATRATSSSEEHVYEGFYEVGLDNTTSETPNHPDVYLDASVSVDLIQIIVLNLQANLNLNAKVSSLVQLTAGVDISIEKVNITITDVRAEAKLRVYLDSVEKIVSDTLDVIDDHPEILTSIIKTVGQVLSNVLATTINALGQTVKTLLDTTGNIVEQILDPATNKVLSSSVVANVLNLTVLSEVTEADGSIEKLVFDPKTSNLIKVRTDSTGTNVLETDIVKNIQF